MKRLFAMMLLAMFAFAVIGCSQETKKAEPAKKTEAPAAPAAPASQPPKQ